MPFLVIYRNYFLPYLIFHAVQRTLTPAQNQRTPTNPAAVIFLSSFLKIIIATALKLLLQHEINICDETDKFNSYKTYVEMILVDN